MPRFFFPTALPRSGEIELPEAVTRHLHVLRLAPGAGLTLFDGLGGEQEAVLLELSKRASKAELRQKVEREAELEIPITIAQGLPEGAKMDWIIEKCVELGAATVQPLQARRSVVKLSGERSDKRLAHWQGVVIAASEQSGRNRLMQVRPPITVQSWTDDIRKQQTTKLLLSPRAALSLPQWLASHAPGPLTLAIGPEGGFAPEEEEQMLAAGMTAIGMGPRILRTETAALAALAMVTSGWKLA